MLSRVISRDQMDATLDTSHSGPIDLRVCCIVDVGARPVIPPPSCKEAWVHCKTGE
jgi:hypothetical protein